MGHSWSVWVPVLPANAPEEDPKHIVAVVSLSGTSDEASLLRAMTQLLWTGILYSQGELGPQATDLSRLNPGINSERCWVMWEGHQTENPSAAIPLLIACPCLFVLGMVLAVVAALRPVDVPAAGMQPQVGLQFFAFSAIGAGVCSLHRHGLLSRGTAFLMAVGGLAAVGGAVFLLHLDWDHVVRVTAEMMLVMTVGLFGLASVANAIVLCMMCPKIAPEAPAPAPYQLANVDKPPADLKQKAATVMAIGIGQLFCAGLFFIKAIARAQPLFARRSAACCWWPAPYGIVPCARKLRRSRCNSGVDLSFVVRREARFTFGAKR